MIMAVQEQGTDSEGEFIHSITAWPEPMCILGYQYQFHDISRFFSSQVGYHPLGIDTTFNLGEFYVTPTAYKSLILENSRDGNLATFIGPTLIHMSRSYIPYCHLASKLLEEDSGIADLRGVVTDGEAGLMKAMKVFYPQTSQLRCSRHFRENCQDKLKSLGIKGNDQKYFMDAIFGTTVDGIFHEGLLDSQEAKMFDALFLSLEEELNRRELDFRPPGSEPQFFSWLRKHDSMMKTALTVEALRNAGFESKKRLTTNPSESVNHVLKEAAEYEEMSLPEFIALTKAVADSQRLDVVRAIVRKGKYRLTKDFSFLEVSESRWMHDMDRSQRDRQLQLVL